jgi:DNA-nicking Smr family endonuclease
MKITRLSGKQKPSTLCSPAQPSPSLPENADETVRHYLKSEDRILWETVARTARPLRPKAAKRTGIIDDLHLWDIETGAKIAAPAKAAPVKAATMQAASETALQSQSKKPELEPKFYDIDRPTIRKIAKGRVEIQARIDLHGMTQREAHDLLYGFLADAWHRGLRFVLVITGKGASHGSEGILKQAVPHWFSTPLFRIYVSAYEDAVRHHGGHGALYVRLRKTPAEKLAEGKSVLLRKGRQL